MQIEFNVDNSILTLIKIHELNANNNSTPEKLLSP